LKRKYLNRIEVWLKAAVDDGVGGNTSQDTFIDSSWSNITTLSRKNQTDFGMDIATQGIRIKLRHRNDLDYYQEGLFFKYKGKEWFPTSIHQIDMQEIELDILATAKR